jgi:5-bromo-4-chloroindolyl phosphate hydrolysis protein
MTKRDETSPGFSVSEKTKVSIPLAALISLLALTATAAIGYTTLKISDSDQTAKILEHDVRIKRLEESVSKIELVQNDVAWIRRRLDEDHNRTEKP